MPWKLLNTLTPRPMRGFTLGLLCALLLDTSACTAQDAAPSTTASANQNMVTQFKGKLKGFQRGMVTVVRDDETEVTVQLPTSITSFEFIATAKPAFLQRGTLVRFNGTFNQAGVSMEPVTKVELFHPVQGKINSRTRQSYIPGVYPERRRGGNQPPPAVAKCEVVGGLIGIDGAGVIAVQAGKRPVRAQLGPDAKFEIRFNDLTLAQEGDPVSVSGFYQPPDETQVKADRITITTDRIYGEPAKKESRRGSRRRTEVADKELDENAAPKE